MTPTNISRRNFIMPERIRRYYLPESVWKNTLAVMRSFGRESRECFFWWGGYITPKGQGQILTAIFPDVITHFGRVALDSNILVSLHTKLRELDQILLVELHSHPPLAGGQNEVDAAYPSAPYPGFISIVIPDFGMRDLSHPSETHVYQYISNKRWRELPEDEIYEKFSIEKTIISVKD